tara:strand:- start:667 stop:921 length:255 start_codon:yes stop_codon:yes gene_type:complete
MSNKLKLVGKNHTCKDKTQHKLTHNGHIKVKNVATKKIVKKIAKGGDTNTNKMKSSLKIESEEDDSFDEKPAEVDSELEHDFIM